MTSEQEKENFMEEARRLFYEGNHDLALYINALQMHNWNYMNSTDDNARYYGQCARTDLVSMRCRLDPDCRIWNALCPVGFEFF